MKGKFSGSDAFDFPFPVTAFSGTAALCAAFAALYALGMPGYDVPGLPFACLVPLLILSTSSGNARQAARRGFVAGTLGNLLLMYWIAYTVAVQGNLGWALGSLGALLVSAYLDGQLNECDMTLRDLHAVGKSFSRVLSAVSHTRIEYPKTPASGRP